mgnify:CR=1 FL=1
MPCLLGLDLGTTNVKALLVDANGTVRGAGSAGVRLHHTSDGGTEQDIEDIWVSSLEAIRQAGGRDGLAEIGAMGVSSQGGAMQMLGPDGKPRGPVISWMDSRGRPWDDRLTARLGGEWFAFHTGHGRSGLTIGQLLRLREQRPELLEGDYRVGYVGDVIVSRLCGSRAHDPSSLTLAMLCNPWLGREDPALLDIIGLPAEKLPRLLGATRTAGALRPEAAAETGLREGIPVSPAVHDQYAAALGCGAVNAGDVMFGAGTAWVLMPIMDRLNPPVVESAYLGIHPVKGLFGQILSMGNGGSAISWMLRTLGVERGSEADIDAMLRQAPVGCDGLTCRPHLAGTAASGLSVDTRGRLDGLTLAHTPAHLLRAVVEGLACELARHMRLLEAEGITVNRLIMCGGAAASEVTPRIIADATSKPVCCSTTPDTSALGAAVIARALIQPDAELAELSAEMTRRTAPLEPGPDAAVYSSMAEGYEEGLSRP